MGFRCTSASIFIPKRDHFSLQSCFSRHIFLVRLELNQNKSDSGHFGFKAPQWHQSIFHPLKGMTSAPSLMIWDLSL